MAALRSEPAGSTLDELAHPVQRLHVVLERGPAEQAALGDIRRAQAWHAALAFDRFDHGRFLAADVGTGAATQLDGRDALRIDAGSRQRGRQRRQLALEQRAHAVVLIAQVDGDRGDVDHRRGDQHALDEAVRIALEKVTVLEGARLALVDVDRHQARRRLGPHDAPFAPGRKPGTAQAAQPGLRQRLDQLVSAAAARQEIGEQRIAARRAVGGAVDRTCGRGSRTSPAATASATSALRACTIGFWPTTTTGACSHRPTHGASTTRTSPAAAWAACRAAPHRRPTGTTARSQTRTVSRGAAAPRRCVLANDVEVVIEARHLEHLGLRELHPLRQRRQVRRRELAEAIVQQVQVFDQQVAPRRRGIADGAARSARSLRHGRRRRRADLSAADAGVRDGSADASAQLLQGDARGIHAAKPRQRIRDCGYAQRA